MTNKLEGKIPTLQTERLVLRPYTLADAPRVQELAGAAEVADMTLSIPHPYEDGVAEEWIGTHTDRFNEEKGVAFAITLTVTGELIGSISLGFTLDHSRAEMGYWIGLPYWNRGYCTEAARAVLEYGFKELALQRILAHQLTRNPASGKVMAKIGMKHEGTARKHIRKNSVFEDLELWGILKDDWKPNQ